MALLIHSSRCYAPERSGGAGPVSDSHNIFGGQVCPEPASTSAPGQLELCSSKHSTKSSATSRASSCNSSIARSMQDKNQCGVFREHEEQKRHTRCLSLIGCGPELGLSLST